MPQLDHADAHAPTAGQRIIRTAGQTGGGSAAAILVLWLLRLAGLDLDPSGPDEDAPEAVVAALAAVLTILGAWAMNRGGTVQRGEHGQADVGRLLLYAILAVILLVVILKVLVPALG